MTSRARTSCGRWLDAVDGMTSASSASSVAVSARPSMSALSILARAGSPMAAAMALTSGRSLIGRSYPRLALTHPLLGNEPRALDIVDDEDELMIVVAVHDLDVDAGLRHATRDAAELAGLVLGQSL